MFYAHLNQWNRKSRKGFVTWLLRSHGHYLFVSLVQYNNASIIWRWGDICHIVEKGKYINLRHEEISFHPCRVYLNGPRQANLLLIAYASSEGSGEPAHPRSLARTFAARSYKQWVKRNLQTESQIPGPSEWLGMRSWNLSWRNARRHKFAWLGPNNVSTFN